MPAPDLSESLLQVLSSKDGLVLAITAEPDPRVAGKVFVVELLDVQGNVRARHADPFFYEAIEGALAPGAELLVPSDGRAVPNSRRGFGGRRAGRTSYANWLAEVDEVFRAHGLRSDDFPVAWFRQRYAQEFTPEDMVEEAKAPPETA